MQPTSGDSFVAAVTGPKGDPGDVSTAQLNAAIAELKNGVVAGGDTLAELYALILLRAPLDGAALTNVTVPTQAPGNNSTKASSTAFVHQELINYALPLAALSIDGAFGSNSDALVPSQKAVKTYVDTVAQGLDPKASVKAATTANITLSGAQTVDGIALVAGNRCLVKNQSTPANNGIYLVASGSWTRATDMDAWTEVPGSYLWVEQGTVNADTGWVCTADQGGTLGSTSVTFVQFGGVGSYTAGTGLSLTGTVFAIDSTVATLTGLQTLTSKSLTAPVITGGTHDAITSLGVRSTGAAFDLKLATSEVLTANRTLSLVLGDAARTLTLGGNPTINGGTHSGTNTGDQSITLTGDVTGTGTGSFATTIGANKVTRAMEAQGIARSVVGVTGNAGANVADIQLTANQFLGVNSAGTILAGQTMSGDATLSGGVITVTKSGGTSFGAGAFNSVGTSGGNLVLANTANTWSLAQTFTAAPVFTDQAGSRTALGLATVASSGSASDLGTGTLPVARLNLSQITNSLGADVNLNNTANFFDGPSIAQGATGTWFVSGTISLTDTAGGAQFAVKLYDGTTVIASSTINTAGASVFTHSTLSGYITSPAGNLRMAAKDLTSTSGKISSAGAGTGANNSIISAFRIN